jgi:hypothetical protein
MGATTQVLELTGVSGAKYGLSCYFAGGDAVNYIVPCTFNGAATASSPNDFVIPEPCRITYISGPATGTLTIDADGLPTPININTASVIAQAARPGSTFGNLAGSKNGGRVRYRLRVVVAMAA